MLIINIEFFFQDFFDKKKVQKNRIYLEQKAFVTLNTTVRMFGVSKMFWIKNHADPKRLKASVCIKQPIRLQLRSVF